MEIMEIDLRYKIIELNKVFNQFEVDSLRKLENSSELISETYGKILKKIENEIIYGEDGDLVYSNIKKVFPTKKELIEFLNHYHEWFEKDMSVLQQNIEIVAFLNDFIDNEYDEK